MIARQITSFPKRGILKRSGPTWQSWPKTHAMAGKGYHAKIE